ncbi:MAG: chromosomal replication initiator protein DnaA [bacterium]|nr:chromosomal replication initiator protein DnaA [bacterium]
MTTTLHENRELWQRALNDIEIELSTANFNTWFKSTCICKTEDGVITLGVPNAFVKEWLTVKFNKLILKTLRELDQGVRRIEFQIYRPEDKRRDEAREERKQAQFTEQMRMQEVFISKEDNLNPKYTFDTFVVGSFNDLAHAAAQAIIANPGLSYNPLFIYGPSGLGKTHLLQAIGNEVKKRHEKKIFYTTIEKYYLDFTDSMLRNNIGSFKEKYRKYDVVIIDDIQFLTGKEKTQEELFHLFNSLHDSNKQIIFSSDRPPKQITGIEDRLRTRFEGGMMVDIARPEFEARLTILQKKSLFNGFSPDPEVLEYIANTVSESIRELEGVLNSVIVQSQLKKRTLSLSEVKNVIKNNLKPQRSISITDVIATVSSFYNISEHMLYEKTRRKEVVKPRQIVMYLLREDFSVSYPYIGQKLGGRDHTTVIHAYEKIKRELKENEILANEIEQVKNILYGEQ